MFTVSLPVIFVNAPSSADSEFNDWTAWDILVNSDISQLTDDQFDSGRGHVCSWVAGRDSCRLPEVQLPERSGKPGQVVPSWRLELVSAPKLCRFKIANQIAHHLINAAVNNIRIFSTSVF